MSAPASPMRDYTSPTWGSGGNWRANAASDKPASWCYHNDSTEVGMGQILVRNLDDAVIKRLKEDASQEGISLEEKARRVLAEGAKNNKQQLMEELKRIRAMSPPIKEPPFSQDLIREDRHSRRR